VGVLALLHAFFVVSVPRVYLGIHYPTDVIAGLLMGSTMAYLFATPKLRAVIDRLPIQWMQRYPGSFYACFFLVSWQIATLFQAPRTLLHAFTLYLKTM
jgi:PAP2 superfamily